MTRDELLNTLTLTTTDDDSVYFEDDERYIDWSSVDRRTGGIRVEVSDGCDTIQVELSREDLERVHRALTMTLLRYRAADEA